MSESLKLPELASNKKPAISIEDRTVQPSNIKKMKKVKKNNQVELVEISDVEANNEPAVKAKKKKVKKTTKETVEKNEVDNGEILITKLIVISFSEIRIQIFSIK